MTNAAERNQVIKTIELSKHYGKGEIRVKALETVNLEIPENEFVAIMGPSGSGKSTLMNILGCLDRPTSGRYILASEDVSDLDKTQLAAIRNRHIGFVFQSYNLLPRVTALENVLLPLLYDSKSKLSQEEQKEKGLEMLTAVGLDDRTHHLPQELSGGQMQRVAIARALVNDPVIILADEPTGNLDSKSGKEILTLLCELHDRGKTIVMVTHEQDIANYAERTIRFIDGYVDSDTRNHQ